jgi:hypothetical protein
MLRRRDDLIVALQPPGQRGDRHAGGAVRVFAGRFAGRAEIGNDCEIRQPERQLYDNGGSGRGRPPPLRGRASVVHHGRDAVRQVHTRVDKPTAGTHHLMEGFVPPIIVGMRGRGIVSAGLCCSITFSSSVIRETRSAARCSGRKIRIPIGRGRYLAYAHRGERAQD